MSPPKETQLWKPTAQVLTISATGSYWDCNFGWPWGRRVDDEHSISSEADGILASGSRKSSRFPGGVGPGLGGGIHVGTANWRKERIRNESLKVFASQFDTSIWLEPVKRHVSLDACAE